MHRLNAVVDLPPSPIHCPRRSTDIPRLHLFADQIPAAVDDGHDEDLVWLGQIDDPVTLVDQLPHIVPALGLGDGAADLREIG